MKSRIGAALVVATLALPATPPAFAGGLAEPVMEPEVIAADTSSSSQQLLVPLLLILLLAAAIAGEGPSPL